LPKARWKNAHKDPAGYTSSPAYSYAKSLKQLMVNKPFYTPNGSQRKILKNAELSFYSAFILHEKKMDRLEDISGGYLCAGKIKTFPNSKLEVIFKEQISQHERKKLDEFSPKW
jgi:hypothetical protein